MSEPPVWVSHFEAALQRTYFWDLTAQSENRWEQPAVVSWQGPHTDEDSQQQYYYNPATGAKQWCSVLHQQRAAAAAALVPPEGAQEEQPFDARASGEEDGTLAFTFSGSGSLGIVFKPDDELDRWYVGRTKRKSQARNLGVAEDLVLIAIDGEQVRCSTSQPIAAAIPATRPTTLTFQHKDTGSASTGGDSLRSSLRQSRHETILDAEETGASPAKFKHWDSMGDDERDAVQALGGTASTWDQLDGTIFERQWEAMSLSEQQGASLLGYGECDFGDELAVTAGKEKDWRQMNEAERSACAELGWTEESWTSGDDAVFNRPWEDLGPQGQLSAGLLGFDMYDFAEGGGQPELGLRTELEPEPELVPGPDNSNGLEESPRTIASRVRDRIASSQTGGKTASGASGTHETVSAPTAIESQLSATGGKGFAVFDLLAQEARRISRSSLAWNVPDTLDELDALFLSLGPASPRCITQTEFERGIASKVPSLRHSKKALRRAFKFSVSEQTICCPSSGAGAQTGAVSNASAGSSSVPREAFRQLLENAVFFHEMVTLYRDMDTEGLDRVYKSSFVERCQTIGKRGKSGPSNAAIERAFAKIKVAAAASGVDGGGEYIRAIDFCEWAGIKRQHQRSIVSGTTAPAPIEQHNSTQNKDDEQEYAAAPSGRVEVDDLLGEPKVHALQIPQTAEKQMISFASREDAIRQLGQLASGVTSGSDPTAQWMDVRTLQWVEQHLAEEEVEIRKRLVAIPPKFRGGKTSVADIVEVLFPQPTEAEAFAEDVRILRRFYTTHPRGQEAAATWHVDTTKWGDEEWSEKVKDMARSFRRKSAAAGKKKQRSNADRDFMYASIASRWGVDPRLVPASAASAAVASTDADTSDTRSTFPDPASEDVTETQKILAHQSSPRQKGRARSRSATGPPPPMRPPTAVAHAAGAGLDSPGAAQGAVNANEQPNAVATDASLDRHDISGAVVAAVPGGRAATQIEASCTGSAAPKESDPGDSTVAHAAGAGLDGPGAAQGAVNANEQPNAEATDASLDRHDISGAVVAAVPGGRAATQIEASCTGSAAPKESDPGDSTVAHAAGAGLDGPGAAQGAVNANEQPNAVATDASLDRHDISGAVVAAVPGGRAATQIEASCTGSAAPKESDPGDSTVAHAAGAGLDGPGAAQGAVNANEQPNAVATDASLDRHDISGAVVAAVPGGRAATQIEASCTGSAAPKESDPGDSTVAHAAGAGLDGPGAAQGAVNANEQPNAVATDASLDRHDISGAVVAAVPGGRAATQIEASCTGSAAPKESDPGDSTVAHAAGAGLDGPGAAQGAVNANEQPNAVATDASLDRHDISGAVVAAVPGGRAATQIEASCTGSAAPKESDPGDSTVAHAAGAGLDGPGAAQGAVNANEQPNAVATDASLDRHDISGAVVAAVPGSSNGDRTNAAASSGWLVRLRCCVCTPSASPGMYHALEDTSDAELDGGTVEHTVAGEGARPPEGIPPVKGQQEA